MERKKRRIVRGNVRSVRAETYHLYRRRSSKEKYSGTEDQIEILCPSCGTKSRVTWSLKRRKIVRLCMKEANKMNTPKACPGWEKFKNLSSFECKCPLCGKGVEIFSDELDKEHSCRAAIRKSISPSVLCQVREARSEVAV